MNPSKRTNSSTHPYTSTLRLSTITIDNHAVNESEPLDVVADEETSELMLELGRIGWC
jgi:hypothetical protein